MFIYYPDCFGLSIPIKIRLYSAGGGGSIMGGKITNLVVNFHTSIYIHVIQVLFIT